MMARFDAGLASYHGYVGYADTTYASVFKLLISTMLPNTFIKHGSIVLQGHEDDRDPSEDVNMHGYPFEENCYVCRSVPSYLEGVLLSYKIERPVIDGFEADLELSLNAISTSPLPLSDFTVHIDASKLQCLKQGKSGSMARAGLETVTTDHLAELIKSKVMNSYIYDLTIDAEHNVRKFNIIVELSTQDTTKPVRLLAGLEYLPNRKLLRLITLF